MEFFAAHIAPLILYVCAILMFMLGIRRFRYGQPFKGLANMALAAVIAIMGWAIGKM
jgi:TM2 domain-containing membrane protein YozV